MRGFLFQFDIMSSGRNIITQPPGNCYFVETLTIVLLSSTKTMSLPWLHIYDKNGFLFEMKKVMFGY